MPHVADDVLVELQAGHFQRPIDGLAFPWAAFVRRTCPNVDVHAVRFDDGTNGGAGVAIIYVARQLDLSAYLPNSVRRAATALGGLGIHPLRVDVAFLEVPLLNESGLCFTRPPTRASMRSVVTRIVSWARDLGVSMLCIRSEQSVLERNVFADLHLMEVPTYDSSRLIVEDGSYDNYRARLSRKQRKDMRRKANLLARAGGEISEVKTLGSHSDRVSRFFDNTTHNNNGKSLPLPITIGPRFFEQIDMLTCPQPIHLLVQVGGELTAFTTSLRIGELQVSKFTGMDYARSHEVQAYFNLYYEEIRLALDAGVREINFGVTNTRIKERLGCVTEARAYWMAAFRPWLRLVQHAVRRAF